MKINRDTLVADIVKENFKTAPLFESLNIDFCCGGNIPLGEAGKAASLDLNDLISKLELIMQEEDFDARFIQSLELDQLADYIEKRHHSYVREKVPFLKAKLEKLSRVHGDRHPELFEVEKIFCETSQEISMHLMKEELILFPQIRKLVKAKNGEDVSFSKVQQGVEAPIKTMLEEHDDEGERFKTISKLTDGYKTPEDGCNTYHVTLQTLKEFEEDLHRHIHLENNILFPEAIKLENKYKVGKGN